MKQKKLACLAALLGATLASPGALANGWTNWLDRDDPGGNGDYELKESFSASQVCASPTAIQTRVNGSTTIITHVDDAPDFLSTFSPEKGAVCIKSQQQDGSCNDYLVRFLCDIPQVQNTELQVQSVDVARLQQIEGDKNAVVFVTMSPGSLAGSTETSFAMEMKGDHILLFDNGQGKDAVAGDGIFTGLAFIDFASNQAQDQEILDRINNLTNPQLVEFNGRTVSERKVFPQVSSDFERDLQEVTLSDGTTAVIVDNQLHQAGILPGVVEEGNALMITDTRVVAHPSFTYDPCNTDGTGNDADPNAAWSFKTLMSGLNNPSKTGLTDEQFTINWLNNWLSDSTINGFTLTQRRGIAEWFQNATGDRNVSPSLDNINLDRLPFRLLSVVNRIDLAKSAAYGAQGEPGETRFVFGLLNMRQDGTCRGPAGGIDAMTVIFEYGDTARSCSSISSRARDWLELDNLAKSPADGLASASYMAALKAITDDVTLNGHQQLNQVRTNDFAFDGSGSLTNLWELREFMISSESGLLAPATIKQTPDSFFRDADTARVADYLHENAEAVLCETHSVPELYQGQPFLGGSIEYGNNDSGTWIIDELSAAALPSAFPSCYSPSVVNANNVTHAELMKSEVRHKFAVNTCDDCHRGETNTPFVHIDPFTRQPSGFLTGKVVADPDMGGNKIEREFDDLARRNQILTGLASSRSCGVLSLDHFHARQARFNFVH